ncbi:MAG TPA: SRPBCC domain-containing protein [Mucilaginibacter sp.]|jgi:uncharacterized protein YndB with AHSA1/START domain|nr:SRPBCC domain-containing protein [Mucilaginibacter sp.]
MKNEPVVVERTYNAPVKSVWEAITDLEKMQQWYFPMLEEFEPEVGFETRFDVVTPDTVYLHIWKIKEVIPFKKISYEWKFGGYPGDSIVSWELFPDGEGTKLILTHTGIETFRGDLHPDLAVNNFVAGWTDLIGTKLREYVEEQTGE